MFHGKKCPIDGRICFLWLTKCKDCKLYKKSGIGGIDHEPRTWKR